MSSDAEANLAAMIVGLLDGDYYVQKYCTAAASVLFLYEAFITFDREVAYFWTAKWTRASFLFFANKWISMAVSATTFAQFGSFPSDRSCSLFLFAAKVLSILQFIPFAAFSALRASALSGSKSLALVVFVLSLAPVATNLVYFGYNFAGQNIPGVLCFRTDSTTAAINLRLVIISRVLLIAADILLICITWTKLNGGPGTLRIMQQSKRLSLSDILVRDGIIYFVALLTLNVLHLALSVNAQVAGDAYVEESNVTIFTSPITAVLVSRFLLELQEANHVVVRMDPDDPLHSSRNTYDTPTFIAPLGAYITSDSSAPPDSGSELYTGSHSDDPWEEEGKTLRLASQTATSTA